MADKKDDVKTVKKEDEKAPTRKDLEKSIIALHQGGMAVDDIIKKYSEDYPMKKGKVMRILGFSEEEIAPYDTPEQ